MDISAPLLEIRNSCAEVTGSLPRARLDSRDPSPPDDHMAASLTSSAACARASAAAPRRGMARTPRSASLRGAGSALTVRPSLSASARIRHVNFDDSGSRRGQAQACRAVDLRKLIERLCDGEDLTEAETEESLDVRAPHSQHATLAPNLSHSSTAREEPPEPTDEIIFPSASSARCREKYIREEDVAETTTRHVLATPRQRPGEIARARTPPSSTSIRVVGEGTAVPSQNPRVASHVAPPLRSVPHPPTTQQHPLTPTCADTQ